VPARLKLGAQIGLVINNMAKETIKRSKPLKEVFDLGYGAEFNMQVARACILFEDLKLERTGIGRGEWPDLTNCNDSAYAQRYFLRRSFTTLCEARNVVVRINANQEFVRTIYPQYTRECQSTWQRAIKFSDSEEYSKIKSVRDALGGHVQIQGALTNAFAGLKEGTTGVFEVVVESGKVKDVTCHFVGELTARAFVPDPSQPPAPQLEELIKNTTDGIRVFSHGLQVLIANHVFPEFMAGYAK